MRLLRQSSNFPMKVYLGFLPEAERRDVLREPLRTEPLTHLNNTDIARLMKHLGKRHPAVLVMIMDDSLFYHILAVFAVHKIVRRKQFFFEGRSGRHYFECRSWFIDVCDGPVP